METPSIALADEIMQVTRTFTRDELFILNELVEKEITKYRTSIEHENITQIWSVEPLTPDQKLEQSERPKRIAKYERRLYKLQTLHRRIMDL